MQISVLGICKRSLMSLCDIIRTGALLIIINYRHYYTSKRQIIWYSKLTANKVERGPDIITQTSITLTQLGEINTWDCLNELILIFTAAVFIVRLLSSIVFYSTYSSWQCTVCLIMVVQTLIWIIHESINWILIH